MEDCYKFCELLQKIRSNENNTVDSHEKANLIRHEGFLLYNEALKYSDESLLKLVTENHFEKYSSIICETLPKSVNNYTIQVRDLLKTRRKPVDISQWKTGLANKTTFSSILRVKDEKCEKYSCNEVKESDLLELNSILYSIPVEEKFSACYKRNEGMEQDFDIEMEIDCKNINTVVSQDCEISSRKEFSNEFHLKKNFEKISPVLDESANLRKQFLNEGRKTFENIEINQLQQNNQKMKESEFDLLPVPSSIKNANTSSSNIIVSSVEDKHKSSTSIHSKQSTNMTVNSRNNMKEEQELKNIFKTAREEFVLQNVKKHCNTNFNKNQTAFFSHGTTKKSLGARRTIRAEFVPPYKQQDDPNKPETATMVVSEEDTVLNERLRNIDPKMVELIRNEIMHKFKPVEWSDIAGLDYAKSTIQEAVVWPILRPDIFTGLRRPPRGILLFGPPGTGKTLIGKCIASQSKSTFFSISASSLTSKWIGDGEKMVRALFAVAAVHQPSVVFIDEIDSLLCQRSETEHESSRRIKTEFLVQLDGAATSEDERILIVGATNRPQELDEAARRRLVRRLYIPLPELDARLQILRNLLKSVKHELREEQIYEISSLTQGYSGADMESLCREASMEPIRSIPPKQIPFFDKNDVRSINFKDFQSALSRVRASVSQNDLEQYIEWNKTYGSGNV